MPHVYSDLAANCCRAIFALRCVKEIYFFTLDFTHVTILAMMTVNQTNRESSWHKGGKLHKTPLFLNTVLFICQSIALV